MKKIKINWKVLMSLIIDRKVHNKMDKHRNKKQDLRRILLGYRIWKILIQQSYKRKNKSLKEYGNNRLFKNNKTSSRRVNKK